MTNESIYYLFKRKCDFNSSFSDLKWVLIILLFIYMILTYFTYLYNKNQSFKLSSPFNNFFQKFVLSLLISNAIRTLSIPIIFWTGNCFEESIKSWVNYMAHYFPSIGYLTSYIYLIFFFIESYNCYCLSCSKKNEFKRTALMTLAIFGYLILLWICIYTLCK